MGQIVLHGIEKATSYITYKRILIVRGNSYDSIGIKDFFNEIPHVEFSGFTVNPLYEQVTEGVKVFNEAECDAIVAVGGGSAIDVAKCIKLFSTMDSSVNYLEQERKDSGIPLIAIPTTAGSGSEATRHAVIYYNGVKQSISHYSIIPNIAILEPAFLKSLPIYQKKCTLLDALSQAIESWWSVNSNNESKDYSVEAIRRIRDNWEEYIFNNSNDSAMAILEAANYAGRAINITATTAAHAMSYKLTSLYNLPHGHAVGICLPEVWDFIKSNVDLCIDERGKHYICEQLNSIEELIDISYYCDMLERMEINRPTATNKEHELDILTTSVNMNRLGNTPVSISSERIRELYERIIN